MQFTQRQRLLRLDWRPFAATIAVGLALGFAGPFGSYPAFPTATRYAFWLGLSVVGALAVLAADAVLPVTRLRAGAIRIGAVALLSALPMTFVVAWTMSFLQPGRIYAPQQLAGLFWGVAAVQLLLAYVMTRLTPAVRAVDASGAALSPLAPAEEMAAPAFPTALVNKLPPAVGSHIVALETEDHYLRVHAAGGSALILMRMGDAIALLDPRLGAQVHRRWWVAEAAVAGVKAEGQKLSLSLTNQIVVPVGRTFMAATRARFGNARNNRAMGATPAPPKAPASGV